MTNLFAQAAVVARRDFTATVLTPTFLIFLLAPLFMIILGVVSGTGAVSMAAGRMESTRIVAIADGDAAKRLAAADVALRGVYRTDQPPPRLEILPPKSDLAVQANAEFLNKVNDTPAILFGPLDRPQIIHTQTGERLGRFLATLAETATRGEKAGLSAKATASTPAFVVKERSAPSKAGRQASGFGAAFGIFFLTLLLAGQSVGMLAEEKTNKVIEILAAAVPLEAVFLGKLVGMFGAALVFVAFWGSVLGGLLAMAPPGVGLAGFQPAVGLPVFAILCAAYFTMAYMLLGAVFLGVGGLAGSMREIQMMSLPITIFQVAMFGLSASAPAGSGLARFAEIFPFSSPFAMPGHAASDPAIWPHFLALAWQALWVAITITVAARMFRVGVLKSGGGWRAILGLRRALI